MLYPNQLNMPVMQQLHDLCYRTLQLTARAATLSDDEYFTQQIANLEFIRSDFEQNFITHAAAQNDERKLVYEMILLIDDLIVMMKQLRGHMHDLV